MFTSTESYLAGLFAKTKTLQNNSDKVDEFPVCLQMLFLMLEATASIFFGLHYSEMTQACRLTFREGSLGKEIVEGEKRQNETPCVVMI